MQEAQDNHADILKIKQLDKLELVEVTVPKFYSQSPN